MGVLELSNFYSKRTIFDALHTVQGGPRLPNAASDSPLCPLLYAELQFRGTPASKDPTNPTIDFLENLTPLHPNTLGAHLRLNR